MSNSGNAEVDVNPPKAVSIANAEGEGTETDVGTAEAETYFATQITVMETMIAQQSEFMKKNMPSYSKGNMWMSNPRVRTAPVRRRD